MRESGHDAAFRCLAEMERIVSQIRAAWPEVKIILRGDSGFCRNELMRWCEDNGVDFVFGLARNKIRHQQVSWQPLRTVERIEIQRGRFLYERHRRKSQAT